MNYKKAWIILLGFVFMVLGFIILVNGNPNSQKTVNITSIRGSILGFSTFFRNHLSYFQPKFTLTSDDCLLLLKNESCNDVYVKIWQNLALAQGLHLEVLTPNAFTKKKLWIYKGIILPDTFHAMVDKRLLNQLIKYVAKGGTLMLVYDAGLAPNNGFSQSDSLLSILLGIDCSRSNRRCIHQLSAIGNNFNTLVKLGIPPGKCTVLSDDFCQLSSYYYGVLNYPNYLIYSNQNTPLLLTNTNNQIIALNKTFGQGQVLFVNLPLTYLASQTDALLLQTFLYYFANSMLQLPTLSAVPQGIGGIVLNLHTESIDALAGFSQLEKIGFFDQRPYSIDFTAGPGLDNENDHHGLDVLNNLATQAWMKKLVKWGHTLGSDGGWLHNYYGLHANNLNQATFAPLIQINNQAVAIITGKKVLEYVPPMGNQPFWAVNLLSKQGIIGYYTTGNTGSSPLINYSKGRFDPLNLWAFPLLPLGQDACFRDFGVHNVSEKAVTDWLIQASYFVAYHHTSKLIYFHPTDILYYSQYLTSIKTWLRLTQNLQAKKVFQWFTMAELAQFLNRRSLTTWQVIDSSYHQLIKAANPQSLWQQSFFIHKNRCTKPKVINGMANIKEDARYWIVEAGWVNSLSFQCLRLKK